MVTQVFNFNITESLVAAIILIVAGTVTYYQWAFTYWKKRGIPFIANPTFPFGSFQNLFPNKTDFGERFKWMYNELKSRGLKHGGWYFFTRPMYMVVDPNSIKNILLKDFDYFYERGLYYNEKDDPLSANLFLLGGEKWRRIRKTLSPAFTAAKIKTMFDNLVRCSSEMQEALDDLWKKNQTIDMQDVSECFTMNVIGSCAVGVECNCFKDPNSEVKRQGKILFSVTVLRLIKIAFAWSYPETARWLGIRVIDKGSTDFFLSVVKETTQFRRKNNIARKDVLQMLLDLQDEPGADLLDEDGKPKQLTLEELTAQVFVFFVAGYETSSLTLAYCMYELSQNEQIQEKVRDEINDTLLKENGSITYDSIMEMKYMSQVVDETLRKYPPVPYITRVCVKDYTVPGTQAVIQKGMEVNVPILGLHYDPDYYPEPQKFDPDRFSDENKQKRHPFVHIPFGEGPRMCTGLRFGLMQVKLGLTFLLKDYKYLLNAKTDVPLQMDPNSFTYGSSSKIYLDMKRVI